MLYYFLISIDRGREKHHRGPSGAGKGSFQSVCVVLLSHTAFIQTPMARQEGCGSRSAGVQPLYSAAAELVCIGANCFFNY